MPSSRHECDRAKPSPEDLQKAGKPRTVTAGDAYIRASIVDPTADIAEGFADLMPNERDALTDADIGTIIEYLKTLK